MPLVEFMKHAAAGGNSTKREIPGFIRGSADFWNPADNTYVGWVPNNRDFYLPDTIVVLDKAAFVARQMAMHQANPFSRRDTPESEPVQLTDLQVQAEAEATYDRIVAHCEAED